MSKKYTLSTLILLILMAGSQTQAQELSIEEAREEVSQADKKLDDFKHNTKSSVLHALLYPDDKQSSLHPPDPKMLEKKKREWADLETKKTNAEKKLEDAIKTSQAILDENPKTPQPEQPEGDSQTRIKQLRKIIALPPNIKRFNESPLPETQIFHDHEYYLDSNGFYRLPEGLQERAEEEYQDLIVAQSQNKDIEPEKLALMASEKINLEQEANKSWYTEDQKNKIKEKLWEIDLKLAGQTEAEIANLKKQKENDAATASLLERKKQRLLLEEEMIKWNIDKYLQNIVTQQKKLGYLLPNFMYTKQGLESPEEIIKGLKKNTALKVQELKNLHQSADYIRLVGQSTMAADWWQNSYTVKALEYLKISI